jgi:hypothetical protein
MKGMKFLESLKLKFQRVRGRKKGNLRWNEENKGSP